MALDRNTNESLRGDIAFLNDMEKCLDDIKNKLHNMDSIEELRVLISDWRGELEKCVDIKKMNNTTR